MRTRAAACVCASCVIAKRRKGLVDRKVIIENLPAAQFHAGCRIRFGPDGKLYVTTGDATRRDLAQKLDSLAGKTLRLNDDGTVPQDNPFVGQQNARPEIWSLGHRNAQGMDLQPESNLMFQTEHGPSGFDGPEEATKSTSSRRERTTVGPPFITRKRERGLSRRCLSTRRRARRRAECFIAARRFRSSREISSSDVCVARG